MSGEKGGEEVVAHRPESDSRLVLFFKAIFEWAQALGGRIVTGGPFVMQIEISGYPSKDDADESRQEVMARFGALDHVPQTVKLEDSWLPRGAIDPIGLRLIHCDSNQPSRSRLSSERDHSLDLPFAAIVYGLEDGSGQREHRLLFVFFEE
ncbi:MAG: hypothetical protein ABIJ46_04835 [bacterium]